jgi:hypothetical protein
MKKEKDNSPQLELEDTLEFMRWIDDENRAMLFQGTISTKTMNQLIVDFYVSKANLCHLKKI